MLGKVLIKTGYEYFSKTCLSKSYYWILIGVEVRLVLGDVHKYFNCGCRGVVGVTLNFTFEVGDLIDFSEMFNQNLLMSVSGRLIS